MEFSKPLIRRRRRWRTAKVCRREQARHRALVHRLGVPAPLRCYACDGGAASSHFWAKRRAGACGCRAKKRGAPKVPGGMCSGGYWGKWRDTANRRIAAHRLCRAWRALLPLNHPEDIEL